MSERNEGSFVFYQSFYKAIEIVPDAEQRANLYRMIAEYALWGQEPTPSTKFEKIIIEMALPQLDANYTKRVNGRKGAPYGSGGGRPSKNPSGVSDENPTGDNGENPEADNVKTPNANATYNSNLNRNADANALEADSEQRTEEEPKKEDIERYCSEKNYISDPVQIHKKIVQKSGSDNPVKVWKLYVDEWEQRERERTHGKQKRKSRNTDIIQRDYDFGEMERQLLGVEVYGTNKE